MQTGIQRLDRRRFKRRPAPARPRLDDFLRETRWLDWPLLFWSGRASLRTHPLQTTFHSLYEVITTKLAPNPAGVYALEINRSPNSAAEPIKRLLPITSRRLAAAMHGMTVVTQTEKDFARVVGDRPTLRASRLAKLNFLCSIVPRTMIGGEFQNVMPVLRTVCWVFDQETVQPPAPVESACRFHRELHEPAAQRAILEYALLAQSPTLMEFSASLAEFLRACVALANEPQRRRGIFLSLIKRTALHQQPFIRATFPTRQGGSIVKWRRNPGFIKTAASILLAEHQCPPGVRQALSGRKSLSDLHRLVTGVALENSFDRQSMIDSLEAPDLGQEVVAALHADRHWVASEPWTLRLTTLAGRFAAISGDPCAPARMVPWLEAWRKLLHPASERIAVDGLEQWLTASAAQPENVSRFLDLLESRSEALLCRGWIHRPRPSTALLQLAALGELPASTLRAIVDLDLVELVHEHFKKRPDRIPSFAGFVERHQSRWAQLEQWRGKHWVWLFAEIGQTSLLRMLLRWCERLMHEKAFTFHDATAFIRPIHDFLNDRAAKDQERRENFLEDHFALLDQILESVENCLRTLPDAGVDNWRSHSTLWTRRSAMMKILYEWECAGFADVAGLAQRLLRWHESADERALAAKEDWPADPFDNCDGNEALIVHLSGGVEAKLFGLLGRFVENWTRPDDPLDGWRFLARHHAVQDFLREWCEPRRLCAIVNILRRFALALRLQCRREIVAGLDRWRTLSALGATTEALAGYCAMVGLPLPNALQSICQREERLLSELSVLQRIRDQGRISASASRRFGKLQQLVTHPAQLRTWIARDVQRFVTKRLPLMKVLALNSIAQCAVRQHSARLLRVTTAQTCGSDWDNALHFYYTANENKSVLRKLLHHETRKDCGWRLRHSPNARFLAEFRANGFDPEAWLAPHQVTMHVNGDVWTASTEQSAIKVLQMGNLFDTCLSIDGCYSFAAIANAVEINKQVFFVRDARGTIIGRKLIGITTDGRLFGFRSYGAACLDELRRIERPAVWVKIILDLACLALIERMRARFDTSANL